MARSSSSAMTAIFCPNLLPPMEYKGAGQESKGQEYGLKAGKTRGLGTTRISHKGGAMGAAALSTFGSVLCHSSLEGDVNPVPLNLVKPHI